MYISKLYPLVNKSAQHRRVSFLWYVTLASQRESGYHKGYQLSPNGQQIPVYVTGKADLTRVVG